MLSVLKNKWFLLVINQIFIYYLGWLFLILFSGFINSINSNIEIVLYFKATAIFYWGLSSILVLLFSIAYIIFMKINKWYIVFSNPLIIIIIIEIFFWTITNNENQNNSSIIFFLLSYFLFLVKDILTYLKKKDLF
jgi:hypothetical protein